MAGDSRSQFVPQFSPPLWVVQETGDGIGQRDWIASALGVHAQCAQVLPVDRGVEGDGGQGHGHIVQNLARALGRRELWGHGNVAQRQVSWSLLVGYLAGEGNPVAHSQVDRHLLVMGDAREAHDQEMYIHSPLLEDLCCLHEERRALVVGEQPQVDDDRPASRDAQGCPAGCDFLGSKHVGLEKIEVYTIRQRVDATGVTVKIALQQKSAQLTAGDDDVGELVNAQFQQSRPAVPQAFRV